MRPQQQNRRMRGRNNNNRKGPNPLTRSYESNGPDVKIRGSAQQIAEKYGTLARDAMSSGDRVMAENYLQHAEHYNRIIAAAQAQMPIQHFQNRDESDEDMDDERDEFDMPVQQAGPGGGMNQQPQQGNQQRPYNNNGNNYGNRQNGGQQSSYGQNAVNHADAPQPVIEGVPAEIALNGEAPAQQRPQGEPRHNDRRRDRRFGGNNMNGERNHGGNVAPAPAEASAGEEVGLQDVGFLQAQPQQAPIEPEMQIAQAAAEGGAPEGEGTARRGRRPRRGGRSRQDAEAGAEAAASAEPEQDLAPVAEG